MYVRIIRTYIFKIERNFKNKKTTHSIGTVRTYKKFEMKITYVRKHDTYGTTFVPVEMFIFCRINFEINVSLEATYSITSKNLN